MGAAEIPSITFAWVITNEYEACAREESDGIEIEQMNDKQMSSRISPAISRSGWVKIVFERRDLIIRPILSQNLFRLLLSACASASWRHCQSSRAALGVDQKASE
jgi:hypothetical protein